MKHIGFDDSLVLREFARLAGEQGFVKEAQPPQPRGEVTQPPTPQPLPAPEIKTVRNTPGAFTAQTIDEQMSKFPVLKALYVSGKLSDGSKFLSEVSSPEFKRFYVGWKNLKDAQSVASLKKFQAKLVQALRQIRAQLKGLSAEHKRAYGPKVQQALQLLRQASDQNDTIKTAKDDAQKYYDVTGETGEQLVEKAHPGGGTKTELTHSKTDENLVETIVEQQKKDIEVAHSVPKGTYAGLVNLYNTLTKMGYKEHLGELKSIIKSIATTEDVVEHVLVSLADQLDSMGYKKSADRIDGMLKKKAGAKEAKIFKQKVLSELQKLPRPASPNQRNKDIMLADWQKMTTRNLTEAVIAGGDLARKWSKMFPGVVNIYNTTASGWSRVLRDEKSVRDNIQLMKQYQAKQKATGPRPGGQAGSHPQLTPIPKKRRTKRGPKIKAFQQWFNQQIKGTAYERNGDTLDVDSIYGPKTKAADHLVRGYGGRAKFEEAMAKKRKTTSKSPTEELPLEPLKWTPEDQAVVMFQNRFGRLPESRAPELYNVVRQWGREEYNSARKYWSEEKAKQEMRKLLQRKINSLTKEDVKQYIKM
jgi:hypothetical protein